MTDTNILVRHNGKICRSLILDPAVDGIFIPPNCEFIEVRRDAVLAGLVAAIAVGMIASFGLYGQNECWTNSHCNYVDCKISASDVTSDYVNVELTLIRGNIRQPVAIRTLAQKAPYICQKTSGHCYATVNCKDKAETNPKLALVEIYRWSHTAVIAINIALFAATVAFVYLFVIGFVYAIAVEKAIERAFAAAANASK